MRLGPFLLIAILLTFAWAGAFLMFRLGMSVHLLLPLAAISLLIHLLIGHESADSIPAGSP